MASPSPAVAFTTFTPINFDLNIGWSFAVNETVNVFALGYFDMDRDGLATAHTVGLFGPGSALLASADVSSGTASPLVGDFRYATPNAFATLVPGVIYFLMANNPDSDPFAGAAGGVSLAPRITYGTSVFAPGGSVLQSPASTASFLDPGLFGPNMIIDSAAVPEPASLTLTASGLIFGLMFLKRRNSLLS
jgi:hypothetical protein